MGFCETRGIEPQANSNGACFSLKRSVSINTWHHVIGGMAHKQLKACKQGQDGSTRDLGMKFKRTQRVLQHSSSS